MDKAKDLRNLKIFWFGFIVYTLSYTISITEYVNYVFCQSLQIVALFLIFYASVRLIKRKIDNDYLKAFYIIYLLFQVTIIVRGFQFEYKFVKYMLFDLRYGFLIYFVPIVMLFPKDLIYLKKVFTTIIILGIFFIIYDLIFISDLLYPYGRNVRSQSIIETFVQALSIPSGFLLLTYSYHSKKWKLFAILIIVLTLIFSLIRARRGLIFISLNMLIFAYFLYYFSNKKKIINTIFSIILFSILIFMVERVYNENRKGLFSFFESRKTEDTRQNVENCFYRGMSNIDWIIGKGINGTYYCPRIDNGTFESYRTVIETGYFQIILKGGIVSLALLLLIAIPAMIKGLFYSKNILSKGCGLWILLFLIESYPGTFNTFTMHYILVWISIGICFSSEIRNMEESEMKKILSS